MRKGILLLVAVLLASMLAFTACSWKPVSDKDCKRHVDVNSDYICDKCQEDLRPNKPSDGPTSCEHVDANNNHVCDSCSQVISEHADANNDHVCDVCGDTISEHVDEDGDGSCDVCGESLQASMEEVNYAFNVTGQAATTLDRDLIVGKFTVVAGSTIRNRTKSFEGVEYNQ